MNREDIVELLGDYDCPYCHLPIIHYDPQQEHDECQCNHDDLKKSEKK